MFVHTIFFVFRIIRVLNDKSDTEILKPYNHFIEIQMMKNQKTKNYKNILILIADLHLEKTYYRIQVLIAICHLCIKVNDFIKHNCSQNVDKPCDPQHICQCSTYIRSTQIITKAYIKAAKLVQ